MRSTHLSRDLAPSKGRARRTAFTLIELLVVIAIIAVLSGILLAAVQRVRQSATHVQCVNNLKQIVLGSHSYHGAKGRFPPGFCTATGAGVLMYILPYIEEQPVYNQLPEALRLGTGGNWLAQISAGLSPSSPASAKISLFICPAANNGISSVNGTVKTENFAFIPASDGKAAVDPTYGWKALTSSSTTTEMKSYNQVQTLSSPDPNFASNYAAMAKDLKTDLDAIFTSNPKLLTLYDASVDLATNGNKEFGGTPRSIIAAQVVNGGGNAGYVVGDLLTVAGASKTPQGGTFTQPAVMYVNSASNGQVQGVDFTHPGSTGGAYTAAPQNPVNVVGGGGTGATFNLTMPSVATSSISVARGGGYTVGDFLTAKGPPVVSSVNPTSGPVAGGTTIIITGQNFTGIATSGVGVASPSVTIGGVQCTNVIFNSDTSITATTPACTAGGGTTPSATLTGQNQPLALAFDSSGNLYVGTVNGTTVSKFAPGSTTPSATLTGMNSPRGMAFDSSGNLFIANYSGNTVSKFAPGSTTPSATLTGLNGPFALAFDGSGNLFVANYSGNTVSRFAPGSTTPSATLTGLNEPYALAFDSSGNLFVANPPGNTVSKFAPGATSASATLTGLNFPQALAFDSSGNLFVSNGLGTTVSKFTPGATTASATLTGLHGPIGLAFDSSGNLFVANQPGTTVSKFAPGATTASATLTGLNLPNGLAFDSSGNLFVANGGNNTVSRFTGSNPVVVTVASMPSNSNVNFQYLPAALIPTSGPSGPSGGGTFTQPVVLKVASLDANGGVGSATVVDPGSYTQLPGTNGQNVSFTGGTGSGATFNLNFPVSYGSAAIANGSGYAVNDLLTVVGGTGPAAKLTVNSVTASGGVTAVTISTPGAYTASPKNPVSVNGGSGTGATFDLTLKSSGEVCVAIPASGMGYSLGDTLDVQGGTPNTNGQAQLSVASVGPYGAATVSAPGTGYQVNDVLNATDLAGTQIKVNSVAAYGTPAPVLTNGVSGSGYSPDQTLTVAKGTPATETSAATLTVQAVGVGAATVTLSPTGQGTGTGYKPGDILKADIGSTSLTPATFTISKVSGVGTPTPMSVGSNYAVGDLLNVGTGAGAAVLKVTSLAPTTAPTLVGAPSGSGYAIGDIFHVTPGANNGKSGGTVAGGGSPMTLQVSGLGVVGAVPPSVTAAGSGYSINDVLQLTGMTTTLNVQSLGASGSPVFTNQGNGYAVGNTLKPSAATMAGGVPTTLTVATVGLSAASVSNNTSSFGFAPGDLLSVGTGPGAAILVANGGGGAATVPPGSGGTGYAPTGGTHAAPTVTVLGGAYTQPAVLQAGVGATFVSASNGGFNAPFIAGQLLFMATGAGDVLPATYKVGDLLGITPQGGTFTKPVVLTVKAVYTAGNTKSNAPGAVGAIADLTITNPGECSVLPTSGNYFAPIQAGTFTASATASPVCAVNLTGGSGIGGIATLVFSSTGPNWTIVGAYPSTMSFVVGVPLSGVSSVSTPGYGYAVNDILSLSTADGGQTAASYSSDWETMNTNSVAKIQITGLKAVNATASGGTVYPQVAAAGAGYSVGQTLNVSGATATQLTVSQVQIVGYGAVSNVNGMFNTGDSLTMITAGFTPATPTAMTAIADGSNNLTGITIVSAIGYSVAPATADVVDDVTGATATVNLTYGVNAATVTASTIYTATPAANPVSVTTGTAKFNLTYGVAQANTVVNPGSYVSLPFNPVPVTDTTTPGGTGASFNVTWGDTMSGGTVINPGCYSSIPNPQPAANSTVYAAQYDNENAGTGPTVWALYDTITGAKVIISGSYSDLPLNPASVTPGANPSNPAQLNIQWGNQLAGVLIGYSATGALVANGGGGYLVGDVLTVAGTNGTAQGGTWPSAGSATQLQVTAINGTGAITAVSVQNPGLYTTIPANSTPISFAGGSGNGAATFYVGFSSGNYSSVPGNPTISDLTNPGAQLNGTTFNLTFTALASANVTAVGNYTTVPTLPAATTKLTGSGSNAVFASSFTAVGTVTVSTGTAGSYNAPLTNPVNTTTTDPNVTNDASFNLSYGVTDLAFAPNGAGSYTAEPTSGVPLNTTTDSGSGSGAQVNLANGGGLASVQVVNAGSFSAGDVPVANTDGSLNTSAQTGSGSGATVSWPIGAITQVSATSAGSYTSATGLPTDVSTTGGGSGAQVSALPAAGMMTLSYGVVSASLATAGSYSVIPTNPVTDTTNGTGTFVLAFGAVTGATVSTTGALTAVPSGPVSVTGGNGNNDATFTLTYGTVTGVNVTPPGGSYSVGPTNPVATTDTGPGSGFGALFNLTASTAATGVFGTPVVNTGGGDSYKVGDVLTVAGTSGIPGAGTFTQPAEVTVATLNANKTIATVNLSQSGSYSQLPGLANDGKNVVMTGGSGTGPVTLDFTFTLSGASVATVVNPGGPIGDTYSVGDLLKIVGGDSASTPGVLIVSNQVEGKVISVGVSSGGYYTTPPTNPASTTDISGTALGATFNLTVSPLDYAPTEGVAVTIPGSSTTTPENGGLRGSPTGVTVSANKYTSTSSTTGTYAVQIKTPFTLSYSFTINSPPVASGADSLGETYTVTTVTLSQNVAATMGDVKSVGVLPNGWANPSQTMADYFNAFWSSQDNTVYTLKTETTVMTWSVVTPGQPAVPASLAYTTLSFTPNPGDTTMGLTNYVGNAGMNTFKMDGNNPGNQVYASGPYFADSTTRLTEITDGTSNTLAFGETLGGSETGQPTYGFTWMGTGVLPTYWDCQTPSKWYTFGSNHQGFVNFAFCDGSVREISKVIGKDENSIPPPEPLSAGNASKGAAPTPRWIAFQLLGGMNDNKPPDWSQLGSGASGN